MNKRKGTSNAHTLFGIQKIPTDTHIRNLLDPLFPEALFVLFRHVFRELQRAKVLERFKTKSGQFLLALDGTEHFSSEKINCKRCTQQLLTNGKRRYSHSVITPTLVSPEQSEVISLEPAFILPQDGEEKQDCEIKAAKGQSPTGRLWPRMMPVVMATSMNMVATTREATPAPGLRSIRRINWTVVADWLSKVSVTIDIFCYALAPSSTGSLPDRERKMIATTRQ
jgi:hypothetical protein